MSSCVKERIKIYTDGSCVDKVGGYGYLYISDNEVTEYSGKVSDNCTNQIAELYAIMKALEDPPSQNIDLYTDSKYAIGCLTEWHYNWKKNGWKNAKGKPVANQVLIKSILILLQDLDVKFYHVRAHKGDKYNERADKLANLGRNL